MIAAKTALLLLPLLVASGCGGGGEVATNDADLAADANLAAEAASDEAADMNRFGGNAAAMDANTQ